MTTSPKKRGRPAGWTKPGGKRQRRDYRFTPSTLAQIEQGRKLAPHKDETDFVEQAIAHYVSHLTQKKVPEMSSMDIEALRRERQRLRVKAGRQAPDTKEEQRARKPSRPKRGEEPTIIVPDLRLTATNWAGFWLRWQQHGLEAIVTLEPVDGRSSASGYQLDTLCQSMARPGQALGARQEKQSKELKRLARDRMLEELTQAGWSPDDLDHPEKAVWRYRPGGKN